MPFVLECGCSSRSFDFDHQRGGLTVYCCRRCGRAGTIHVGKRAGPTFEVKTTGPAHLILDSSVVA
jgi:hypothetical protein